MCKHTKSDQNQNLASRAQNKDWELAGSKMGNVLGIVEEKEEEQEEEENYNAKAGSQFKEHMQEDQKTGATAFSRSKTIKQQREFLPIYASRAELLKIIRENSVVVIVGETGSGKRAKKKGRRGECRAALPRSGMRG